MPPETRYARSGDVNIAYQVVGDAPRDLVHIGARVAAAAGPGEWHLFALEAEGRRE
jgi:hypothetical protein